MTRVETPVLVVGAGPAGLTCSLLLSHLGIRNRLIERRAAPQSAPAAHVVNARTLEIFRAAGVDMTTIEAACQNTADSSTVLWVTTLVGEELGRLSFEQRYEGALAVTPTPLRNLSQHLLEPILLDEVRRRPHAGVAYGHEWESAEQDAEGVTSRIRDHADATVYEVRSRWLLAADGAASPVRRSLGIEPVGPDRLQSFVMIHFEANLRPLVGDRPGILYWTTAPGAMGTFIAHDIDSTWVYMHPWDPDRESADDYSEAVCADIVRRAMGTDAHPFTVRTIRTWTMTAQVAERYREGRIFLVGDSAHRFPPTGGLGLNTGVQDAHNLAWKIAAREAGWAPAVLLDSYETERRPVAQQNADASLRNAVRLGEVFQALASEDREAIRTAIANQAEHFDMPALQLGFTYEAGVVAADGSAAPARAGSVREYVPNARPGSRIPHTWVTRAGIRVSTLDLFAYDCFTLVAGPAGQSWTAATTGAGQPSTASTTDAVPVDTVLIGRDVIDPDGGWMKLLDIDADGAVLVRPDQHVAWRSRRGVADCTGALRRALAEILSRERAVPVTRVGRH